MTPAPTPAPNQSQGQDLGPDLAEVAARLGWLLHAAGVPVTPERSGRLAAAMTLAEPATTSELYWTARVTLVGEQAHLAVFDRVFAQVFGGLVDPADYRGDAPPAPTGTPGETRPREPGSRARSVDAPAPRPSLLGDLDGAPGREDPLEEQETVTAVLSGEERLRSKDFASLTPDELARLRALAGRMGWVAAPRSSRRYYRSANGRRLDLRATLRRSRRTGGEPLVAVRRRRRNRPRRLVLLCDISGSMEPYARAYLQLLMGGVDGARAEAFVFATRLTRLTRSLRGALPATALERAGRAAPDWSGGTRIGDAVKAFNDNYGRRGMARGAVIVVLSDGWDTGDPRVLQEEMTRLRRLAHRVIWVNPRKAAPGYAPLTGGMVAALPHVDVFVSGHSLVAFDEVLDAIASSETVEGRVRP
ncbi:VWA domain-containing protein [Acidiferrimicrobium sp. IK]|uniref:vWA domain-containing protein n=1 Tax=Acidiferrimicrobium sp. IK TaxID=2871700 RepID=UPI0021CB034C|nr:VWA domain-containing protein [Acidiferrimicrobium sp. IK]MCU4186568.1 VWA domain-containing protein [Acidiferrimicrobium sp. IK]